MFAFRYENEWKTLIYLECGHRNQPSSMTLHFTAVMDRARRSRSLCNMMIDLEFEKYKWRDSLTRRLVVSHMNTKIDRLTCADGNG